MLDGLAKMLRHTLGPSVDLGVAAEPGCPTLLADAGAAYGRERRRSHEQRVSQEEAGLS
jgi:hypothetical protein